MPVLHIQTNLSIANKAELLSKASTTIASALNKPESYVMVVLTDDQTMCFAGSDDPLAYLELKSLGLPTAQTALLSSTLCQFLHQELEIDSTRVYIEFSAPERSMFGWNSSTF